METPTDRIVNPSELADRLGISRVTLWRARRRGEIPPPIQITAGRVGWRESTISNWLDRKQAEAQRRRAASQ